MTKRNWGNLAGWVQAACTVALVGITAWYTHLNHELLEVQVAPAVEVSVDTKAMKLEIRNVGLSDVVSVSVDSEQIGPGVITGRLFRFSRLGRHQEQGRSISGFVATACHNYDLGRSWFNSQHHLGAQLPRWFGWGGPMIVLRVSYYRAVDMRRFAKTLTFLASRDAKTGKPLLIDIGKIPGLASVLDASVGALGASNNPPE